MVLRLEEAEEPGRADELHALATKLLDAPGDVTVDCTGTPHLDTAALQILAALALDLGRRGRSLELIGVGEPLARYLALAGLDAVLRERPTATLEALA